MNDLPLLTAEQVAHLLNVKRSTVYALAHRRLLPFVRLATGRRRSLLRFKREEIEKVIRERSKPVKAEA